MIYENRILIKNNVASHSLVVKDLYGVTILTTTVDLSLSDYQAIELPLIKLSFINMDNDLTRKVVFGPDDSTDYIMTDPPLAPGELATFWIVNQTYDYNVYYAVYTETDGKIYTSWVSDDSAIGLPYVVEGSIIIPLQPKVVGEGEDPGITWWQYLLIVIGVAIVLGFIVLGMILRNKGVSGGLAGLLVKGSNVLAKKSIAGGKKLGKKMTSKQRKTGGKKR